MNVTETTDTFFEFFTDRGHQVLPGSSLVPPGGDPVLFTTSGMHPLTPYLEGLPHPQGRRLTSLQRCVRTTDLAEVGDNRHLTVFQMLGSWSLGDYDGPQSLRWGCQLLVDGLGIGRDRLHATVFGGDDQVGPDLPSLHTWAELGVPVELTTGENWWSNGPTGPCGPDSEIFAWTGDGPPQGTPGTDERWMELWNHVSMRYLRHADGSLEPLPQRNVDTGMGLERLLMVLQGKPSVFDCDVFQPWTSTLASLWQPGQRSMRLLADHLRASIVIIGDGVGRQAPAGATCCGGCCGARSPCCGAPTAQGRLVTCHPRCSSTPWHGSASTGQRPGRRGAQGRGAAVRGAADPRAQGAGAVRFRPPAHRGGLRTCTKRTACRPNW